MTGRHALDTGAFRGIGAATTAELAAGHRVAVHCRSESPPPVRWSTPRPAVAALVTGDRR